MRNKRLLLLALIGVFFFAFQLWCYIDAAPLVEACFHGDTPRVEKILKETNGRNINRVSGSPILLAWHPEFWPKTALQTACTVGDDKLVVLLLEYGADPRRRGIGDRHPLNLLVCYYDEGDDRLVRAFVNRGASVETRDDLGRTGLLESAGCLPNVGDGEAYIHSEKAEKEITEIYRFLRAHASDKDPVEKERGTNAFLEAARADNLTLVKYILDKGYSDINFRDKAGQTALFLWDVEAPNDPDDPAVRMVKFLLRRGIDVTIRDNDGMTALEYSRKEGYTEIVKLLEKAE